MSPTGSFTARVVTALRYRNVDGAAEWLQAAFGFSFRARTLEDDGRAGMVQLTYGNHLIMMLPVGGSELDDIMRQPDEIGGAETQSCYLVVDDIECHHTRAKAAGAEIVSALKAFEKGGRGYTCRDLEGHHWSFGTYDPWSEPPAGPASSRAFFMGKRFSVPASCAAVGGVVVLVGAAWGLWYSFAHSTAAEDSVPSRLKLANERADQAIDLAARKTSDLAKERAARKLAGLDALRAKHQLALERGATTAAKEAAAVANEAAARERALSAAAEQSAATVRKELILANAARLRAERTAAEAAEQLKRERAAREGAEKLAKEAQDKLRQAQLGALGAAKAPKQSTTTKKAANPPIVPASPQPLPPLLP